MTEWNFINIALYDINAPKYFTIKKNIKIKKIKNKNLETKSIK